MKTRTELLFAILFCFAISGIGKGDVMKAYVYRYSNNEKQLNYYANGYLIESVAKTIWEINRCRQFSSFKYIFDGVVESSERYREILSPSLKLTHRTESPNGGRETHIYPRDWMKPILKISEFLILSSN